MCGLAHVCSAEGCRQHWTRQLLHLRACCRPQVYHQRFLTAQNCTSSADGRQCGPIATKNFQARSCIAGLPDDQRLHVAPGQCGGAVQPRASAQHSRAAAIRASGDHSHPAPRVRAHWRQHLADHLRGHRGQDDWCAALFCLSPWLRRSTCLASLFALLVVSLVLLLLGTHPAAEQLLKPQRPGCWAPACR